MGVFYTAAGGCKLHGGHFNRGNMSQPPDTAQLTAQLIELRIEHRDLNEAIDRLAQSIQADELAIKRLKKRKLRIKDMMTYLENKLIPDLDA